MAYLCKRSKLSADTGHARYIDAGEFALARLQPALAQASMGFAWWLCALDFVLTPPKEIVVVSPSTALGSSQDESPALLGVVFGEYRPNQVVAWKLANVESATPLLAEREAIDGKAAVYVRQNFAYQLPVTEADKLKMQLGTAVRS